MEQELIAKPEEQKKKRVRRTKKEIAEGLLLADKKKKIGEA